MARIRVVLADDHPVIRGYIRRILEKSTDLTVVGEAGDGLQILRLVYELEPDVVLLDMEMPGLNGAQVTQKINEKGLSTRVLVISSHDDKHFIMALFRIGIAGYLVKDEVPECAINAVQAVASGQHGWVSHRLAARFSSQAAVAGDRGSTNRLSDFDREVLYLHSLGKTNLEISEELGVKSKVISDHLQKAVTTVRNNLSQIEVA